MALDLRPERFGSKATNKPYVSGEEIIARANGDSGSYVSGAEILARIKTAEPVNRANKLLADYNRFVSSVERDTEEKNRFNAADYFEERKRQADELKQRAISLSRYAEENAESFTPESYDDLMRTLSTFDTAVDDVLSFYKPSLDAREGMRAYEDEFIAAQERNAQQKQWEKASDFAFEPGSFAANMMPLIRQKMFDEGDRGVTDNWSAEQRYRLGLMQMEDPNQAKSYAEEVNAGRDPYLIYQQQEQQKADWRAMDLNAERREIDRLKAEMDDYYWNSNYDATSTNARNAFDQEVKRREKEISDREQQYNLAKREQDNAQFRSAADRSDFATKSGYVSTGFQMPNYVEDADPDELVYEYINNPEIRSQINQQTFELAQKGYDLLEPEEVSIYNYYYATEGPAKAQQYLDNIQDTLNQRLGELGAASKDKLWKQLMAGVISGYSNAVTSPQYFFDKESDYINTSPFQYMSAFIREDLADTGKLPFFDTSLGQMAYDLVNTTANMVPAMMLSGVATAMLPGAGATIAAIPKLGAVGNAIAANAPQIGAAIGSATMGLSASGGAYQQALNAGYTKEQAKKYAALSGASEVALEYLLGGISKLGGEIPQAVLSNMVSGVDNAIARAAITLGGSMASEGFEEGLQEVITPWIENLTLYADKDVDWNEVAYSTLLGALSGGFMEGPAVVSNEIRSSRTNKLMELAAQKVDAEMAAAKAAEEQHRETESTSLAEAPAANNRAIQISTKNPIDILDFDSMDGKNATLQLKDGGTVDYDDVNFADQQQANQFYAVRSLPGLDTEAANDLLHTIQDADAAKDIDSVVGIRDAYRIGYFNLAESDLAKSDSAVLSPQLRKAVFDIGRKVSQVQAAVQRSAKVVTAKPTGKYKKIVLENPGMKITTKRRAELDYVDKVADAFAGTTVHVFESYKKGDSYYFKDSHGKEHKAPNGRYINGEIWLDINAGDKDGLILHTFAHEMYHHIEAWNKTKANELASFVARELVIENVDKAVADQIEKARAAGYGEEHFIGQGKSETEAENEVYARAMSDFVADSLETMFTRGKPAEAIARLHSEDKGLFDKLKKFIDKWISHVKAFYKDKTISQEGAAVAQLKNFEELQRLFMEAMQGAGENYREAEVTAEQDDAKFQARSYFKNGLYSNIDNRRYWYPNMTKSEIAEVKSLADYEANTTDNYLGIDAKWLYNNKKGHKYFALYSTADAQGTTLLYACKGKNAEYEYNILKGVLEMEDGLYGSTDSGSETISQILDRTERTTNRQSSDSGRVRRTGSNNGNASVHSKNTRTRSSAAFRNCLENISKVQSRYGIDDHYLFAVERGDLKTAQQMVDKEAKRWGAFLNNSEANEVFPQSGEVRTFYHGTNTGDFTVFDKGLLGSSSGDLGWFGKGFYFAFSADEANTYGGRVIRSYLKMKNPYDYSQLYKFKGSDRGDSRYARFAWLYNIVKQFPDIVTDQKVYAYPNDSEEGKAVSWKQLVRWMDRIEKDAKFSVAKVELSNGDTAWELRANPKQESFTNEDGETFTWTEYGMRQLFATEMDAKEPINQIGAYLVNVMGVESIPRRSIEKIDFSGAVQRAGYDGILQSPVGDEAVVFDPSQIKLTDPVTYDDNGNVIPLSERFNPAKNDIRYSLRNQKPPTVREILMGIDISNRNKAEQYHLGAYQERVELLAEEQPKLEALQAQIKELEADGKRHLELNNLRSQERKLRYSVQGLKRSINNAERYDMFRRIVAEERKNLQEQQSRDNLKAYKEEQKEKVKAMQTEQKVLRAQLKNSDDFATVMGEELAKIAKDYEAQKIDLKTKDEQIRRLERQYSAAKARIERNKESLSVQKQRKHVEEKSKSLMKMLTNPTKDAHVPMELQESLREFLNSIDFTYVRKSKGGAATVRDIAYTNALEDLRRAVAAQRSVFEKEDGTFKLDVPPEFMEKIDDHIKTIKDATKGLDLNTNRVYEMSGAELKDLSYLLGVINKAIREIDKFHLQGEKARTSGYAQETVQEMSTRKPVKGEEGNKYLWGNSTPWYAFRRYGKAGQRIFKGLMQGQAKLARNTDSIVKFAENTYTSKEVREWERERHTIKLDSGKTVTMSTAQIMSFWCLSHRDQAIPHMQGGGMRLTTLKKDMDGTNVQKEVVQKEHFTLTLEDVNRINNLLTGRQQEVARKLQQFMQTVGGRFINEISMARWDFMAATETDYFPIQTDDTGRDAKNPDQERTSLFALLNKSFTKAPMKNAKNALVIDSIFNVFANHMSETAEYNAFALPLVDAMKWFNYKERVDIGEGHIKDVSVQKAIEDTLGKNARRYFIDLMTDINSSQKAGRHEDVFGKILGRSKVSSVAWNSRVAIQQISALPRASMVLKPRYLLSGASKFRLQYAVKEMQKYSGIALWKSMGYYDLNVARSVEQQIKHDTSLLDQFNEMGMWLPGKMDERTWARIWIATREQIRNDRKLSGEELLQATADLFEDVVYQTQVADSVLTRSSFMRSKSQVIKEATSFMAEPTLATNVLMYAFEDYEAGHTTWDKAKRGLMIGFTGYALGAVANALLGSLSDAWRDDDEYETYWEKYGQALFGSKEKYFLDGNLFSELNPLEKFIFVKDILSVAKGFEPHSSYSKLISSGKDLLDSYQSAMEGKGSKTTYGVVYQTLQYLSTLSGTALGNMTREVEDLWNNTFGKEYPDLRLEKYKPDNGDELLQAIQKGTEEDIQRVFGRFENQQQAESALQSAIGEQYRSGQLSAEEAEQLLTDNFDREDEHEVYWLFDKWDYAKETGSSEGWTKYGKFFEGVENGDFQSEMNRLMEHGAEASDIQSQITRTYRKKYLENPDDREAIREKIKPVYEATGMYDDEILQKFHDWDFEAEYGMTYGEMKGEFRDGNVTENELRQAMKFYGRKNYQIEEDIRNLNKEIKFYDKYEMSMSEMTDAYDRGDVSRNTMIGAKVFNGMTKKEAQEWVNQRDISNSIGIDFMELDDAYKYGDISRTTLRNAILKNGETPEKADEAMMGYDWLKKNVKRYPDLAISDAKKFAVRIHSDYAPDETLADYGVSIDAYIEYQRLRPECKGVDANGDGKTDDGTLRDSVFRMIDSLPISSEAKDGLALMSYSAKSIRRNAPWH